MSNNDDIANQFNEHFIFGPHLASKIANSNENPTRYISFSPTSSFVMSTLHWGPQIQHINNELMKNVGINNKLRYYVDVHTLKQLYYSFIYPYLTYGITSWGSAYKTRLQKIKTKQNKCVHSIFFAHSRDSATSYFNLLQILTQSKTFTN